MQGAERHTAILQPAPGGLLTNIQLLRDALGMTLSRRIRILIIDSPSPQ